MWSTDSDATLQNASLRLKNCQSCWCWNGTARPRLPPHPLALLRHQTAAQLSGATWGVIFLTTPSDAPMRLTELAGDRSTISRNRCQQRRTEQFCALRVNRLEVRFAQQKLWPAMAHLNIVSPLLSLSNYAKYQPLDISVHDGHTTSVTKSKGVFSREERSS